MRGVILFCTTLSLDPLSYDLSLQILSKFCIFVEKY